MAKDVLTDCRPTIAIDLDGTLAEYKGWRGEGHIGKPIKNARWFCMQLKKEGWRIIIWTVRQDTATIKSWLLLHKIPFDAINVDFFYGSHRKVIAHIYLDDRGINFNGKFSEKLLQACNRFHSHYEKGGKKCQTRKKSLRKTSKT